MLVSLMINEACVEFHFIFHDKIPLGMKLSEFMEDAQFQIHANKIQLLCSHSMPRPGDWIILWLDVRLGSYKC